MKTVKMRLKDLNIDPFLVDFRRINVFIVGDYRQLYRGGANFPLIIIDKDTNNIISGNHRYSAMLAEFGEDHQIEVIAKKYKNKKEVLIDFLNENIQHGYPLDSTSKKRICLELSRLGVSTGEIANLFNLPYKKIESFGALNLVEVVYQDEDGEEFIRSEPKKRGVEIPEGKTLTEKEYKEHIKSDKSMTIAELVLPLLRRFENNYVAKTPENHDLLMKLTKAINLFFKEFKKAA